MVPFSCWIMQKKNHKENLGNRVHNSFTLIELLHSCSGGLLLIPKGSFCSLISNRLVVIDDDDNDTSMEATMIRHCCSYQF